MKLWDGALGSSHDLQILIFYLWYFACGTSQISVLVELWKIVLSVIRRTHEVWDSGTCESEITVYSTGACTSPYMHLCVYCDLRFTGSRVSGFLDEMGDWQFFSVTIHWNKGGQTYKCDILYSAVVNFNFAVTWTTHKTSTVYCCFIVFTSFV